MATNPNLYVLSDLHLAPRGDLLSFHSHAALVSLIDTLAQSSVPVRLILNGDVFDFLQLPDYQSISLPQAPARMEQILAALDTEPPATNIVQALRRFTAGGHYLHCLPGNHDPELNLTRVQDVLVARLGASAALPFNQGCWAIPHVGGAHVVTMHGHWKDPFNAISSETMLQAQAAGDATVPLPPGSRLVLDVLNPYRRAIDPEGGKRFPFIDLLPSEMAVVFALLYLDPKLARRRISTALQVRGQALLREVMLFLQPNRLLNDHAPATAAPPATPVLAHIARELVACMSERERASSEMVQHELQSYLQADSSLGVAPAQSNAMLSDNSSWVRRLLLRALAKQLAEAQSAFAPEQPDELANDSIRTWGHHNSGPVIALTGHTHAAKFITHPAGIYINSGTWQDLVRIPADLSETALAIWLQDLQNEKIPRWRRCPVVRIDENGPALLHWDGEVLQDWHGALGAA